MDAERAAKVQRVADAIDDPCDDDGFDQLCRNSRGELCRFHAEHCHPPHYPCLVLLRNDLAERIVAGNEARRAREQ